MGVIIVVNNLKDFNTEIPGVEIITAKAYLSEPKYVQMKNARVFNFCRSYSYQSTGYYISLLAQARGHKVMPDITTIQDTKTQSIIRIRSEELDDLIQRSLNIKELKGWKEFELDIFFGKTRDAEFQTLGRQLFYLFQTPFLKAFFSCRNKKWYLTDVDPVSPKGLNDEEREFLKVSATGFFAKRLTVKKQNIYPYELAILVNPDEKEPPSNKKAIKKFIKAAENLGIGAWTITRDEYNELAEYDALFIRETTNVNHYTYRFARRAAVEGLVVLDDPESILKCSNKVYMAELMDRNNIPTPKTMVIHKDNCKDILQHFELPVILKLPDSCFSMGVKKAKTVEELDELVKSMLDKSDLIIAQEFLQTDFDWRVGIIDRKAIYACKYYMAGGHWQIMNWQEKGEDRYGLFETFAVEDVPPVVIETALKAANLIGDGIYGVDLKEAPDGQIYLIEINDNPNIDNGIEDQYLQDELYTRVMEVFLQRMRKAKPVMTSSVAETMKVKA